MTKRKADEPDNKAAERLKQFREARGLPEGFPEESEVLKKKTSKSPKTKKSNEGTK